MPAWHPNFRNYEKLPDIKVVRTAFFVNGVNCALTPSGQRVSINTINNGLKWLVDRERGVVRRRPRPEPVGEVARGERGAQRPDETLGRDDRVHSEYDRARLPGP